MPTTLQFNEKKADPKMNKLYRRSIAALKASGIPFMVGGAAALACYTGIVRDTKDFDIFIHPRDLYAIFEVFRRAGFKVKLKDNNWLGKAFYQKMYVDIIFGSLNAAVKVDDEWFNKAHKARMAGYTVSLIPPEEMLWSKAFVMARERFDGADIMHLILTRGKTMDWWRLYERFGQDWRLLYAYVILFTYIYPGEKGRIPEEFIRELSRRFRRKKDPVPGNKRICRGTLISPTDYNLDVLQWGFIGSNIMPREAFWI